MPRKWKRFTSTDRTTEADNRLRRGLPYIKSNLPIFKPGSSNIIRLVPPLEDDELSGAFGVPILQLYFKQYYLSPRSFDPRADDPLDDLRQQFRMEDPTQRLVALSRRTLCFVLDFHDNLNSEPELSIWSAPQSTIDDLLKASKNRRTGQLVPLDDPLDGVPINFCVEGTGDRTRYSAWQLERDPYPLDDELADQVPLWQDILEFASLDDLDAAVEDARTLWDEGVRNPDQVGAGRITLPKRRSEVVPDDVIDEELDEKLEMVAKLGSGSRDSGTSGRVKGNGETAATDDEIEAEDETSTNKIPTRSNSIKDRLERLRASRSK